MPPVQPNTENNSVESNDNPPVITSSSPSSSKRSKKIIIAIVSAVLLLTVTGIGGFFVYQYNQNQAVEKARLALEAKKAADKKAAEAAFKATTVQLVEKSIDDEVQQQADEEKRLTGRLSSVIFSEVQLGASIGVGNENSL